MSDLAAFLLARIAEDEAIATVAAGGAWTFVPGDYPDMGDINSETEEGDQYLVTHDSNREERVGAVADVEAEHMIQWQPRRVLAECEAKRSLISLHPEAVSEPLRRGAQWAYDEILRRLALLYADHPDYRQEWRP